MNVWAPTEAGAKLKENPAWMAAPKLPTIPTIAPLRARVEKPDARAARIAKTLSKDAIADRPDIVGTGAAGWKLTITDGHRAIFQRTPDAIDNLRGNLRTWPTMAIALDVDTFHAFTRAHVVAKRDGSKDYRPSVTIAIDAQASTMTLTASDDWGTSSTEVLDIVGVDLQDAIVRLDTRYVLDALGTWPIVLRIGSPDAPVWFVTEENRYVVMPMKESGNTAAKLKPVTCEDWTMSKKNAAKKSTAKKTVSAKPVAPAKKIAPKVKTKRDRKTATTSTSTDAPANDAPVAPAQPLTPAQVPDVAPDTSTTAPVSAPAKPATDVENDVMKHFAPATPAKKTPSTRGNVDWKAAGRKAYETRMRRKAEAAAAAQAA